MMLDDQQLQKFGSIAVVVNDENAGCHLFTPPNLSALLNYTVYLIDA